MNRLRAFLFLMIVFITLQSCSSLKEIASVQKPIVSLSNYPITGLSLSEVEVTFDIKVDNPNPLSIDVDSYSYNFDVEGNSFLSGTQRTETNIPASSAEIIQLPVSITFSELYQSVKTVLDQDEVNYTLGADVNVTLPLLGAVNIPVEQLGTFPVVKLPSLSLGGLKVKNLSFTKADFELELNIDNPNNFGISMNEFDYALAINGLTSLNGELSEQLNVAKKSSSSFKIPISVNLAELGLGVYRSIVNGEDFNYSLNGTANVGSDLAIFKNSSFNFDKSGVVNILD